MFLLLRLLLLLLIIRNRHGQNCHGGRCCHGHHCEPSDHTPTKTPPTKATIRTHIQTNKVTGTQTYEHQHDVVRDSSVLNFGEMGRWDC